jgi:hypothetical protein
MKTSTCCKQPVIETEGKYFCSGTEGCGKWCEVEDTPKCKHTADYVCTNCPTQDVVTPNSLINDIYFLKHTEYSRLYDVLYNNEDASKAFLEYIKSIKQ